jgi:hypothetical protein
LIKNATGCMPRGLFAVYGARIIINILYIYIIHIINPCEIIFKVYGLIQIGQKCGVFIVRVYLTLIRFFVTLYRYWNLCVWMIEKEKKRVVSVTCLYSVYKGSISPHSRHCCDGVCLLGFVSSPLKK